MLEEFSDLVLSAVFLPITYCFIVHHDSQAQPKTNTRTYCTTFITINIIEKEWQKYMSPLMQFLLTKIFIKKRLKKKKKKEKTGRFSGWICKTGESHNKPNEDFPAWRARSVPRLEEGGCQLAGGIYPKYRTDYGKSINNSGQRLLQSGLSLHVMRCAE